MIWIIYKKKKIIYFPLVSSFKNNFVNNFDFLVVGFLSMYKIQSFFKIVGIFFKKKLNKFLQICSRSMYDQIVLKFHFSFFAYPFSFLYLIFQLYQTLILHLFDLKSLIFASPFLLLRLFFSFHLPSVVISFEIFFDFQSNFQIYYPLPFFLSFQTYIIIGLNFCVRFLEICIKSSSTVLNLS
jgi:hypothetical protein